MNRLEGEGVIGRGSTNPFRDELLAALTRDSRGKFIMDSFGSDNTIDIIRLKKFIEDKLSEHTSNLKIYLEISDTAGVKTIVTHVTFDVNNKSVFSRHIKTRNRMNTFKMVSLKARLHSDLILLGSHVKENEYYETNGIVRVELDTHRLLQSIFKKSDTKFEYQVNIPEIIIY